MHNNTFKPSVWAKEIEETKKDPMIRSYNYYLARYMMGLSVPEFMIQK